MSEKSEVFEIIKSVITSQKGGVLLKDINRDYRNLAGGHIPFKNLGYRSIEQVLDDIPEVQSYVNDDGQLVFINKGKNCEHLLKLISKQKNTNTKKLKPCNLEFHQKPRKPRNSDIGAIRNEHNKEKENYTKCSGRRSVGSWQDVGKKKCTNNNVQEQKSGVHPRKIAADCYPKFSQRGRGWKPLEHIDESFQHEQRGEDPYDPAADDRIYLYKSSKLLGRRESFHDIHGHDHRDTDICPRRDNGLQFSEDCDFETRDSASYTCNKFEKYTSSRAGRSSFLADCPNASHNDVGSYSPAIGNHYKYPKNHKYRNHGDSRYVPEDDEWDADAYYDHKYGGRSEMHKSARLDESDACGSSGRKINLISGSLRVTIRNC